MKISNVLILLAIIFLAIKIPSCLSQKAAADKFTTAFKPKIDEEIANQLCIMAPNLDEVNSRHSCFNCDQYIQGGLLSAVEENASTDASFSDRAQNYSPPQMHYELSEIGMKLYQPAHDKDYPRFCFGKLRVHHFTRTFGPVMLGNAMNFGMHYVAEVINPEPYLFDSRARTLHIPLPMQPAAGQPTLMPEANVTAVMRPDNPKDFYLDGSLEIGPIDFSKR